MKHHRNRSSNTAQTGFTLTEIAVVMVIVSLLIGGMLMPLSGQQDLRAHRETTLRLGEIRDSLLGFAALNQRLPCPASAGSNGRESFCTEASGGTCTVTTTLPVHGRCSNPFDGFLPAASLGFFPVDTAGYAVDGWGSDVTNRVRYALTNYLHTPATTTFNCQVGGGGTADFSPFSCAQGVREIYDVLTETADIRICNSDAAVSNVGLANADCTLTNRIASDVVAVIYSTGKNSVSGGTSALEQHNPNPNAPIAADRVFAYGEASASYDDQMLWISRSAFYGKLISAGRLP